MQRNLSPRRAAWIALFALVIIVAMVVPALATTSWQPTSARIRYQDEPRSWDSPNVVAGIPNGGGTGGQFPENGQSFATGFDPGNNRHYRYAVWTSDRNSGNEQEALVQYGGPGNPQPAKDCSINANPASARNILNITSVGTTLTITLVAAQMPHRFFVGDKVIVAGNSVTAYNGVWTVASNIGGSSLTATYAGGGAGTGTGGTIKTNSYCSGAYFARSITDRAVTTVAVTSVARQGAGGGSGIARYTTSVAHGLAVGDPVNVWGVTGPGSNPDMFDLASTVTAVPSATTFEIAYQSIYGTTLAAGDTGTGGTVYKSTWVWDGGGSVTGCASAYCTQYGRNAYPLSPLGNHTQTTSIAAVGPYVFVLYSTTIGYYKEMCQWQPRIMYVRTNTHYGDADAWQPAVQLSNSSNQFPNPTDGFVGYGTIGAGGTQDAYASWTNSINGRIVVAVTHNAGASWSTQVVGSTRKLYADGSMGGWNGNACQGDPWGNVPRGDINPPFNGTDQTIEGFDGAPNIAGNGSQVGIIWEDGRNDSTTRVKAKISTNNGDTWPATGTPCVPGGGPPCSMIMTNNGGSGYVPGSCSTTTSLTGDSAGTANCTVSNQGIDATGSGVNGRIGFLWGDGESTSGGNFSGPRGMYYREWNATTGWGATRLAGCMDNTWTTGGCSTGAGTRLADVYNMGYSPSVVLYGTTGVAYAASGCRNNDAGCTYSEIFWRESGNNGTTWHDGCDGAGGACDRFKKIANNSWNCSEPGSTCGNGTAGKWLNSAINDYASVELDKSTGAASLGCASTGTSTGGTTGLPETGCKRFVYYLGRDSYYMFYRMYTSVGSAT